MKLIIAIYKYIQDQDFLLMVYKFYFNSKGQKLFLLLNKTLLCSKYHYILPVLKPWYQRPLPIRVPTQVWNILNWFSKIKALKRSEIWPFLRQMSKKKKVLNLDRNWC